MRRSQLAPLAVAAGLLLAACQAGSEPPPPPQATAPATAAPAVTAAPLPSPASKPEPVLPGGSAWAVLSHDKFLPMFDKPVETGSQPDVLFDQINPFGQDVPFLVTEARRDDLGDGWLKVLLPTRPNDHAEWVRESDVKLVPEHQRIVIDVSSRTLAHFVDGKRVDRFSVGVGRPDTPTATGTFYAWAHVPQSSPSGPYGVFALGLSGFSEVLHDWPGGGRMAIHGTANPADRGQMVSHGCIRVYNADMATLTHVPLGTPVIIKR